MSGNRWTSGSFGSEEPFRAERLPYLEVEKLDDVEKASIERAIVERDRLLVDLQTDVLDLRSERNALDRRVSQLETERADLRERVRELEASRPAVEPREMFSTLGAAFDDVDVQADDRRYTVRDIDFTLKANVVQTDEGIRLHLPSLDERSATGNLSELSFRLRSPPPETDSEETSYVEIPDLVGLEQADAARSLATAGLDVGAVTTVEDLRQTPGTVVDQFPEPFAVAPPGAPVDLTLAAEREPSDTDVEGGDDEPDSTEPPLETIDGIGPTYASRLREVGVDRIADLARLDADAVAEITGASPGQTERWVAAAQSMAEDR